LFYVHVVDFVVAEFNLIALNVLTQTSISEHQLLRFGLLNICIECIVREIIPKCLIQYVYSVVRKEF